MISFCALILVTILSLLKSSTVDSEGFISLILNNANYIPLDSFVAPCDEYDYFEVNMIESCLDLNIAGKIISNLIK